MKYDAQILKLLHKLGIQKLYKGCEYIISCINFIATNESCFTPVTKVLYIEVAKQYNTSNICIEKNVRSIIKKIWSFSENNELIRNIFGEHYIENNPGNIEFLMLLYQYLKNENLALASPNKDYTFICPLSGDACEFCKEFIIENLNNK